MFEVGKKYKSKGGGGIYECVYSGTFVSVLKYSNTDFAVHQLYYQYYKEYKEPVVHTRYVHWYKNTSGEIISIVSKTVETPQWWEHLKTEKITYTEEDNEK